MIQNIFFDMDGVVVDSEPIHARATQLVLDDHKIFYHAGIFDEYKRKTDEIFFQHVSEHLDVKKRSVPFFMNEKDAQFEKLAAEMKFIDGFTDFYKTIRSKKIRTALVSSTSLYSLQIIDNACNIKDYFDLIITSSDTEKHKPFPEPYLKALEKLPAALPDTIVIEDSVNGIISAREAGCFVYGITTSFAAEELRTAGATDVVDSYAALYNRIGTSLQGY